MPVLDYGSSPSRPRFHWRWIPAAAVLGLVAGAGIGNLAYDPLLHLLSRGVQLYFTDLGEPFSLRAPFIAVFSTGGALVCCSAALLASSVRGRTAWAFLFVGLFAVGAAAGMCYARSQWNPTGFRYMPVASAPMLVAPLFGCASVFLGLGIAVTLRVTSRRS